MMRREQDGVLRVDCRAGPLMCSAMSMPVRLVAQDAVWRWGMAARSRTQLSAIPQGSRIPHRALAALVALVAVALLPSGASAQSPRVTLVASAEGDVFHTPYDAAPNPDGTIIYFIGGIEGVGPALFSTPADGSDFHSELFTGSPLVAPRGLVVSSDNGTVYIADPRAGSGGAVIAVAADGSAARTVAGSEGTAARAIELAVEDGRDVLYFTGMELESRQPALFRLDAGGAGAAAVVFQGAPLVLGEGVALAANGDIYISSLAATGDFTGVVLRVRAGTAEVITPSLRLGSPAGIALTADESTLLVSGIDAEDRPQVVLIDLATGAISTFNEVIGSGRAAGGLHRAARQPGVFAWADSSAGAHGRVFRVNL
jgi:DNA-binding beta-propeller fold protein YncE